MRFVAEPEGCLELSGTTVTLTADQRLEQRMTGTFAAKALSVEGNGMIEVTVPGLGSDLVEIDVVEPEEPLPPPAPLTFEFERAVVPRTRGEAQEDRLARAKGRGRDSTAPG